MTQQAQQFDTVGFIIDFEGGNILEDEEIIEGFQHLIDTGVVWTLQGSYGRMAADLIDRGLCKQSNT